MLSSIVWVESYFVQYGEGVMSRLSKVPLVIPKGVKVFLESNRLKVEGPKGSSEVDFPNGIVDQLEEDKVVFKQGVLSSDKRKSGLYRAIMKNMVQGVSLGFKKTVLMVGVGYRSSLQNRSLDLFVGNSHPNRLPIPDGIQVSIDDKGVTIIIAGVDKQLVGQFAALVRSVKPPEPYKGKGIRYQDEHVRKKAGKAGKKTAGG